MSLSQKNITFKYSEITFGIIILFILFLLPYIIFGKDSYIRIHDTLEGELGYIELLRTYKTFFSVSNYTFVDKLMDGLPRNILTSPLSWSGLMYYFFGGFWGYVLTGFISRIVGFVSFYILLSKLFKFESKLSILKLYISLLYSILPFFPTFGIYLMGVPLLFVCFYYIYFELNNWLVYPILFLYTFFSNIVWSGAPLIILLFLGGVFHFMKHKEIKKSFIYCLFIVIISNLVFNYNSIHFILSNHTDFINHRIDYCAIHKGFNIQNSILNSLYSLFLINYHVGTNLTLLVLISSLVFCFDNKKHSKLRALYFFIISVILVDFIYDVLEQIDMPFLNEIKSFRLNRMIVFIPFCWVMIFWLSINKMVEMKFSRSLVSFVLFVQFFISLSLNDEFLNNFKQLFNFSNFPTYNNYFQTKSYNKLALDLPEIKNSSSKIISFGLSPSIAQHNGYNTADGYFSIYNLHYKRRFKKLIDLELDKSPELKEKFDCWGNRCYLFSSEISYNKTISNFRKDQKTDSINCLQLRYEALNDLHVEYIFSSILIKNFDTSQKIKLIQHYHEKGEKPLFVYKYFKT